MQYIAIKEFNNIGIDGNFNISIGEELTCENRMIKYKNKTVCMCTSENAHTYFMRDDDGKGIQRGELIEYITTTLALNDKKHDERWEAIINDPTCQAYKRPEHSDVWLWNHAFYNTTIEALTYIKSLIEEV